MQYLCCKNGSYDWNPNSNLTDVGNESIYVIDNNNDILIFYQKQFDINDLLNSREEILFYISSFGFSGIKYLNFSNMNNSETLCNFCRKHYHMTFRFTCNKKIFTICHACWQASKEKENFNNELEIHINTNNKGWLIKMFVKHNRIIKGFYKGIVKSENFDFLNIINLPWHLHVGNDMCYLCNINSKYKNYSCCSQCYNFSFNNGYQQYYQQYYKILLIKDICDNDIYFNIYWLFVYLIKRNLIIKDF